MLTPGQNNAPVVEPLNLEDLSCGGWKVQSFGAIDSTNEVIKQALRAGDAEGTCAVALYQSGGYGRQGRSWVSPLGGLYASFAFRPNVSAKVLPTLGLALSCAVRAAIERVNSSCKPGIKWPNDVLCAQGKLAGISQEVLAGGICVGIGINGVCPATPFEPGGKYVPAYVFEGRVGKNGLSSEQRIQLIGLFAALLDELQAAYKAWCTGGFAVFRAEYEQYLSFIGSTATLETIDGGLLASGVVCGINEQGSLLLQTDGGTVCAYSSGEVHIAALD